MYTYVILSMVLQTYSFPPLFPLFFPSFSYLILCIYAYHLDLVVLLVQ